MAKLEYDLAESRLAYKELKERSDKFDEEIMRK